MSDREDGPWPPVDPEMAEAIRYLQTVDLPPLDEPGRKRAAKERAAHDRRYADGAMSCPCGRGDYDLCRNCPYDWCSVHGTSSSEEG